MFRKGLFMEVDSRRILVLGYDDDEQKTEDEPGRRSPFYICLTSSFDFPFDRDPFFSLQASNRISRPFIPLTDHSLDLLML